jgi:5-methyltetrahydrofolate--homocysteine methyltransferase
LVKEPALERFRACLSERVLIFDGAMGTGIHALDLPLSDYKGLENCSEVLNLTRPDAIERIHRGFFEVGCDVVETNTFGGMKHVLAEFDMAGQTREINLAAAQVARRAADAFSTPAWPRFVAGSLGPGTKLVTLRQISYDELFDSYYAQACALLEGGVDVMTIETCQDILQSKCVIQAVRMAFEKIGRRTPLMVSVTMETTGTMLVGTDIAAALTSIEAYPEVDVIGLNCATGPQEMSEHIRYLARTCTRKLSVMPNAGLPQVVDGRAHFPLSPTELARWLKEFVDVDGVNIVGGCCGTTAEHLRAVVAALRSPNAERRMLNAEGKTAGINPSSAFSVQRSDSAPLARSPVSEPAVSSLYQSVPLRQDNSFLIVGERCNTNGSKKFKEMLAAGDLDGCVHLAVEQVKEEGAHVLDVCVDYVGRDGVPDMRNVIDRFSREVIAPLMLDSTQPEVIEAGLKLAGGKCIINSVNLEDGEEKLAKIAGLCRKYGAAVVALTIDEDPVEAMAKTADRKLQIATRIRNLLVDRHGMREEDIFWDCLTFPITTGNEADRRLALETLDGIERVMKAFPRCQSILGLSNVSFGLKPLARVVLNSVYLNEARQRGLTAAIVHAGKILPRSQISDERWNAALDLIYDRRDVREPLEHFIGLFPGDEKVGAKAKISDLPVEERLKRRIIDGNRTGLEGDLDEAMTKYPPLEIINTLLLDGMKVVGELFGSGQMQLPFVLKSAETMKSAVAHLEPHMEKVDGQSRGRIVLATVRGDVHDIGKNLVDIILTNNGYTVYNLGIKQPINNVIAAFRQHGAQAIGLSGLLVKSTLVMRDDLAVLNEQQIDVPVILGGAALTRKYVEDDLRCIYDGAVFYARDAFDGLSLMGEICEGRAPRSTKRVAAAVAVGTHAVAARIGGEDSTARAPVVEGNVGQPPSADGSQSGPPIGAPALESQTRNLEKLEVEIEQRYGLREMDDDRPRVPSPEVEDNKVGSARRSAGDLVSQRSAGAAHPSSGQSNIRHEHPIPAPPFWGARVVEKIALKAVLAYVNETMLFQVQWGFRKKGRSPDDWKQHVSAEIRPIYRELVERCERESILKCQAVYGYWPCNSDGDDLVIYEEGTEARRHEGTQGARELCRFTFPRQKKAPYWCLSDFWRPLSSGSADVVAFHIVTAGRNVSEVAREWFKANQYQQYLFLHGLGVETAEALAEYMHKQIRSELGIGGKDARELQMLFKQGYQGSRYSFGYPACPRLEDQRIIMKLLKPERIGIELSEEYQLEPEQSTSAIIAHHPQARYFNVR